MGLTFKCETCGVELIEYSYSGIRLFCPVCKKNIIKFAITIPMTLFASSTKPSFNVVETEKAIESKPVGKIVIDWSRIDDIISTSSKLPLLNEMPDAQKSLKLSFEYKRKLSIFWDIFLEIKIKNKKMINSRVRKINII